MRCRRPSGWKWPMSARTQRIAAVRMRWSQQCVGVPAERVAALCCVHTDSVGSAAASADAILLLDEYRLFCAGAVGTSMRGAIAMLEVRLHRQIVELREREHALRNVHPERTWQATNQPA